MKSLMFAARFAYRDLFAPESRRTFACSIAIFVGLIGMVTWGYALVEGAREVRLEQMRRDGENRCVRGGGSLAKGSIDDAAIDKLVAELERRLKAKPREADGDPVFEVASYCVSDLMVQRDSSLQTVRGRTFAVDDPLLRHRRLVDREGRNIVEPDRDFGVFLTPDWRIDRQGQSVKLPEYLSISLRGVPIRLDVLGLVEKNLPDLHLFLESERTYQRLKSIEALLEEKPMSFRVRVPLSWALTRLRQMTEEERENASNAATPPPEFLDWARRQLQLRIETKVDSDARAGQSHSIWLFQSLSGGDLTRAEYIGALRELLDKFLPAVDIEWPKDARAEFEKSLQDDLLAAAQASAGNKSIATTTTDAATSDSRPLREFVSVYVRDYADLEQVAEVMSGAQWALEPNTEFAQQRGEIAEQADRLLGTFQNCFFLSVIIGLVGQFASEVLRAESRKAEIGMLRAIGLPNATWNAICVVEAAIQSLAGGLLVAGLTILAGRFLAVWAAPQPDLAAYSFPWTRFAFWQLLVLATMGAFLLNSFVLILANLPAKRGDPAELVRL
jgi:hypothetical protein